MSYDFSMCVDVGGDGLVTLSGYDFLNYTYNVGAMFKRALAEDDGIWILDGKTGEECLPYLKAAIKSMSENMDKFRLLNPENGWGSAEGALKVLKTLHEWCEEVPKAILRIS